jgi:hypothetical protein
MLLSIASVEREHWEFMVREDVRIACTHISDVEGDGGTFDGEWDEDHEEEGSITDGLFDRLTICSRYAAQLGRGETRFEVADKELPALKRVLRAQMQADGEELSDVDFYGLTDSPVPVAARQTRIELVNSLADQIGGLL